LGFHPRTKTAKTTKKRSGLRREENKSKYMQIFINPHGLLRIMKYLMWILIILVCGAIAYANQDNISDTASCFKESNSTITGSVVNSGEEQQKDINDLLAYLQVRKEQLDDTQETYNDLLKMTDTHLGRMSFVLELYGLMLAIVIGVVTFFGYNYCHNRFDRIRKELIEGNKIEIQKQLQGQVERKIITLEDGIVTLKREIKDEIVTLKREIKPANQDNGQDEEHSPELQYQNEDQNPELQAENIFDNAEKSEAHE
jgi:hypothetical protein